MTAKDFGEKLQTSVENCGGGRGDAAFASPGMYVYLENKRFWYAIRLPANEVLYERIDHLLTRPVGRPPKKPIVLYESFQYQAASWDKARRVVGKVEWHAGELFPRVGFIVTNLRWKSKNVVSFYNKRGTLAKNAHMIWRCIDAGGRRKMP